MPTTVETMRRAQLLIFRGTLLLALLAGAVSPVFRDDGAAKAVGVICVVILTCLAAPWVLHAGASPNNRWRGP
jgi:hypothetical protein